MVHEEDAVPLAGEGQKKLREFPLLPGPKPRPRLVQKEDLRPRGEEPGKLQKALLPRREPVRPLPSKLPQAHPPEGLEGGGQGPRLLLAVETEKDLQKPRPGAGVGGQGRVLQELHLDPPFLRTGLARFGPN